MGAKNPVLVAQRKKFETLHEEINAIQMRALEGNGRDLTEDELKQVENKSTQLRGVAEQIEQLADLETRSRAVSEMAAKLLPDDDGEGEEKPADDKGKPQTRSRFTTQDRDPGHYRSIQDGGKNSFFSDMFKAKAYDDENAARRLVEHHRALDTANQGVGVVPPKWLTSEFETLARQGRALANAVRQISLGDDPRPMTMPKQTVGTDDVVTEQTDENDPVDGTDEWDSDVDTVTPKPTTGKQIFSRQMLDMSDPAIDQLIYGDLLEVFNLKVEKKVGAALIAAAGSPVTTFAAETNFVGTAPAMPATDAVIDAAIAVRNARKMPASLVAMTVNRYGKFLKLKDTTGRPVIPSETAGPMNVAGVGTVAVDGRIEGLGVVATDGIGDGTTSPEKFLVLRPADTILFESNMLRFRYEEQAGPESIVLGIWAYTAVVVRQKGAGSQSKSVRAVQITTVS